MLLSVLMLFSVVPVGSANVADDGVLDARTLYAALMTAQSLDEFSYLPDSNLPDEDAEQELRLRTCLRVQNRLRIQEIPMRKSVRL